MYNLVTNSFGKLRGLGVRNTKKKKREKRKR